MCRIYRINQFSIIFTLTLTLIIIPGYSREANAFQGDAAFAFTRHAVSFGARPSGSPAITRLRNWIRDTLKPLGCQVDSMSFTGETPMGPVPMVNLIAKFPGKSGKIIAITGHYDTKHIPMVNFVGANDGGSSTGFLLALAQAIAHTSHQDEIDLVWFDGEEAVGQWSERDSLYGSRYLLSQWIQTGTLSRLKALINVDMIGDRNLDILNDSNSSQTLRNLVWQTADSLGYGKYFLRDPGGIDDDHLPFAMAGVNALDLIDFNFGPGNRYWHKDTDTMDKLSPHSFQVVGDVVLASIKKLDQQR